MGVETQRVQRHMPRTCLIVIGTKGRIWKKKKKEAKGRMTDTRKVHIFECSRISSTPRAPRLPALSTHFHLLCFMNIRQWSSHSQRFMSCYVFFLFLMMTCDSRDVKPSDNHISLNRPFCNPLSSCRLHLRSGWNFRWTAAENVRFDLSVIRNQKPLCVCAPSRILLEFLRRTEIQTNYEIFVSTI